MSLENNSIAQSVTEQIREHLYNDLEKSDIKTLISDAYPHFNDEVFEMCFTEAFTTL